MRKQVSEHLLANRIAKFTKDGMCVEKLTKNGVINGVQSYNVFLR